MNKEIVCLYPDFGVTEPLQGLYLRRELRADRNASKPFVYANFLSSLDGRIALRNSQQEHYQLPATLKSEEDFRLFLELYAHADCIVTHGGYMRALAAGRLGNVLQIPQLPWTQYIHSWRKEQGLASAPDVVIVSGTLDFPWHDSLNEFQQNVHIVTGAKSNQECEQRWAQLGQKINVLGQELQVEAQTLIEFISMQGYRSVYLVAGPQLLQDMLVHKYLDRFFITMCHQLLGGNDFKSLIPSQQLAEEGNMQLHRLYMDSENSSMLGQWYAEFSCKNP